MTGNPWAILGISKTAGVAEIRRAYAERLKNTRPDEDPEAFQKLVEAREVALAFVRSSVPKPPPRPTPGNAPPSRKGTPSLDPPAESAPVVAEIQPGEALIQDSQRPPDKGPPWLEAPAHGAPILPPVAPLEPALDAVVVQEVLRRPDQPPPRPEEPAHGTPIPRPAALADRAGPVPHPWTRPRPGLGEIARWLDELRGATLDRATAVRWQVVLSELSEMSLAGRRDLEERVILAVDSIVERLYPLEARSPDDVTLSMVARIATAAADEFGWLASDRALHEALPPSRPRAFRTRLDELRAVLRSWDEDHPNRADAQGFPVLPRSDLDSYFRKEAPRYVKLLQLARQRSRWTPHLDWQALLLGPFWAFWVRRPFLFVAGLFLYLVCAGSEAALRAAGVSPASALAVGFLPPALFHLYLGLFGYRVRLQHLHRLARKADNQHLFAPEPRETYVAAGARQPVVRFLIVLALLLPVFGNPLISPRMFEGLSTAVTRRVAMMRSAGVHTLYDSPTRSLTVERRLAALKQHPATRPGPANSRALDDFSLALTQAEAELIGAGLWQDYRLLVHGFAPSRGDAGFAALILSRQTAADLGRPSTGYRACQGWEANADTEPFASEHQETLRRLLEQPVAADDPHLPPKRHGFTRLLAELNGYLLRDRRGGESVGYMRRLTGLHTDPGYLQGIATGTACALNHLWRQLPKR